jgi:hypothetical protein
MRLYPGRRGESDGGVEVVHDECAREPALATLLGSLQGDGVPTPLGVLRAAPQPSYDELVEAQEARDRDSRGPGSLRDLLFAGDLWQVE